MCSNRVFRTDAFKSLCLRFEAVNSNHNMHTGNTVRIQTHDTVQNGDITISEEDELNLLPSLIPTQERQQSIRSSKSMKMPSASKKYSKSKRPPVGSLGKLVLLHRIAL